MKSYGLTMHPINPIRTVLSTFGNCFVCFLHLGPMFLKVRLPGNLTQNLKNLLNWLCKIVPKESKVAPRELNLVPQERNLFNWGVEIAHSFMKKSQLRTKPNILGTKFPKLTPATFFPGK